MKIEKIELDRSEVNALIKAILYLKFECEDTDSLLYCSSPIINSSLSKLLAMYGYEDEWGKVFSVLPEANKKIAINKIKRSESEEGVLDEKIKKEVLEQYLFPYRD
ncbi:hypothetical protein HQN64_23515 [Enterobacteriaceae bacterium BIT-l23]|jgi:N-acetylglutamate synthase/N-acetylornithine aminotransferase|uniref:hypothetical protein n=1 Tax=Jejubacter sp. L23 TaxID=3092086 RepID=UPI0015850DCD|nr:hypothetical protein [Enterobacteriaceae bacterium BIT-l23]